MIIKKISLFVLTVSSLTLSQMSYAAVTTIQQAPNVQQTNQAQTFDPSAPISLTKDQADQVNAKLDADKAKSAQVKLANAKRDQVIMECGKLFDSGYSDASLQKVKACLNSNNGNFPSDQQISNATPLDSQNLPANTQNNISQNSASVSVNQANTGELNQSNVSFSKKQQTPNQNQEQSMSDVMRDVLR